MLQNICGTIHTNLNNKPKKENYEFCKTSDDDTVVIIIPKVSFILCFIYMINVAENVELITDSN